MTTPQERFRALTRFAQLLELASTDEQLAAHLRLVAQALRSHFPQESDLPELVRSARPGLCAEKADVRSEAVRGLHQIGGCRSISGEVRSM